ncbi:deoxyribodipyrimidine photo-lyase [Flaviaesturariibacter amylovorans]|uniref:Deoxyribodipyrimidine photo-lyase n=1 Tax=Flaviaesturariibacter amylovorans TaxID=1084520 RepID=A0ABP8H3M1_9BACT
MVPVALFWFRRDLRLHDNAGLCAALRSGLPIVPVFIFDPKILSSLDADDRRVSFIYSALEALQEQLVAAGTTLQVLHDEPLKAFATLCGRYHVAAVYTNEDYEPYARQRDAAVAAELGRQGIAFLSFQDQVLQAPGAVQKEGGGYYQVYTPFYRRWQALLTDACLKPHPSEQLAGAFHREPVGTWPSLAQLGFRKNPVHAVSPCLPAETLLRSYHDTRNLPAIAGTTRLGVHLRFGTVSIRALARQALDTSETFLKELAWREFFMQLLAQEPRLVSESFRKEYDAIDWRQDEEAFGRWCAGTTGYPLVDAGMRELQATGFMHNRVRMVTASFLVKHLLIDWRRGEAHFARLLLDFDLSSNNGNWQWVAGCGCDAAPYFRVFNPQLQAARFDPDGAYVRQWVPEWGTSAYPNPIVDHKKAVARCVAVYKKALAREQLALFP